MRGAPNPKAPTLGEAMEQALTPDEQERLEAHMRPLANGCTLARRRMVAYLWAVK